MLFKQSPNTTHPAPGASQNTLLFASKPSSKGGRGNRRSTPSCARARLRFGGNPPMPSGKPRTLVPTKNLLSPSSQKERQRKPSPSALTQPPFPSSLRAWEPCFMLAVRQRCTVSLRLPSRLSHPCLLPWRLARHHASLIVLGEFIHTSLSRL